MTNYLKFHTVHHFNPITLLYPITTFQYNTDTNVLTGPTFITIVILCENMFTDDGRTHWLSKELRAVPEHVGDMSSFLSELLK